MGELNFQTLTAAIEEQLRQMPFHGIIHIAYQDAPLFSHAYGLANRSDQLPNRLNTRFGIASSSKIFTATAICQLVSNGKLAFEQPIAGLLPGLLPNLDARITLRHLLTHTSGIPDYFDEELEEDYEVCWRDVPVYRMRTALDFLPFIQDKEMKFSPGARFGYNNLGFILLGLIVDQVSGQSFQSYIEEKIFGPAWMRSSGYFASDCLPEHCATGYLLAPDGTWRSNIFSIPVVGQGDGGAYTTAADLGRFWKALFSCTYFNTDILAQMIHPQVQTRTDSPYHYGYGVWIDQLAGATCYSVWGEDPSVESYSAYYPEINLQITLLANTTSAVTPLANIIRNEIFG